jgi:hypothetical protein
LLYFRVAEIAQIFAFMMAFAFLESLLVTAVLVGVSAILPSKWLREGFSYKSLIVLVTAAIAAIILQRTMQGDLPTPFILFLIWFTPLVWSVVIIIFVQRRPRLQNILLSIADRISIMLFLYGPIGLLSLLVVTLGNLI